jgi:hypothetical protein
MPLPEHPFNGHHTSYRIDQTFTKYDDGSFDLKITPQGVFQSGTHTPRGGRPVNLTLLSLSNTEIELEDSDGNYWGGYLMADVTTPQKQVTVGMYSIPISVRARMKGRKPRLLDQDNGIWVATKP